jgi:hypothetical protein
MSVRLIYLSHNHSADRKKVHEPRRPEMLGEDRIEVARVPVDETRQQAPRWFGKAAGGLLERRDRRARLHDPRQGDHRDTPRPADQRGRARRPLLPTHPTATTHQLALGRRLATAVHRRDRATHTALTDPRRQGPTGDISGTAGQTGSPPTPPPQPTKREINYTAITGTAVHPG